MARATGRKAARVKANTLLEASRSEDVVSGVNRGKSSSENLGDVLDQTLNRLLQRLARNGVDDRILFPSGIGLIYLKVVLAGASAEVKVASDPKAGAFEPDIRNSSEPDSCREAGIWYAGDDLKQGEKVPNKSETVASGAITKKIRRTDPEFATLVQNTNAKIIFKDEEQTGADRMMTQSLSDALDKLADDVANEWTNVKLRVTEAWDEENEHTGGSLHYEGRAADLTTWPIENNKLGRLGRLAVNAGFNWVWYENTAHIHVSVRA